MDIKKTIEEAIKEVQSREVTLVTGKWGVQWNTETNKWELEDKYQKQCCALGAVLLKHQPKLPGLFQDNQIEASALFLGVSEEYVNSLVDSFDSPSNDLKNTEEARLVGIELHKQFQPKASE